MKDAHPRPLSKNRRRARCRWYVWVALLGLLLDFRTSRRGGNWLVYYRWGGQTPTPSTRRHHKDISDYVLKNGGEDARRINSCQALELEEALAAVDALEVLREDEGQDGHELHEDVEGGPRRVLEGVADRVARDGRVVRRRAVAVAVLLP